MAPLIASHDERQELVGTLLLLLPPLPTTVVEVARLKLLPRQPMSLKGASMESYKMNPLYVD